MSTLCREIQPYLHPAQWVHALYADCYVDGVRGGQCAGLHAWYAAATAAARYCIDARYESWRVMYIYKFCSVGIVGDLTCHPYVFLVSLVSSHISAYSPDTPDFARGTAGPLRHWIVYHGGSPACWRLCAVMVQRRGRR